MLTAQPARATALRVRWVAQSVAVSENATGSQGMNKLGERKCSLRLLLLVTLAVMVSLHLFCFSPNESAQTKIMMMDRIEPRVMMMTYLFGQDAVQKRHLQMFVDSAHLSGIDVAIVLFVPQQCV